MPDSPRLCLRLVSLWVGTLLLTHSALGAANPVRAWVITNDVVLSG